MSKRAQMRQRARAKPREDRTTLWITIATVAVAAVILVALVLTRQPGTASTTTDTPAQPNPEVARIGLADARARFQQPGVVFLDTRSAQEYADSHISGAVNIPLPEIPTRFNEIPRDAEVIAYCTWPNEETSAGAARQLLDRGYTNVKALLGGYRAWTTAGYPTETK